MRLLLAVRHRTPPVSGAPRWLGLTADRLCFRTPSLPVYPCKFFLLQALRRSECDWSRPLDLPKPSRAPAQVGARGAVGLLRQQPSGGPLRPGLPLEHPRTAAVPGAAPSLRPKLRPLGTGSASAAARRRTCAARCTVPRPTSAEGSTVDIEKAPQATHPPGPDVDSWRAVGRRLCSSWWHAVTLRRRSHCSKCSRVV